jgi:hypothetical protein
VEIVTLAFPVFFKFTVAVALLPTVTLPKFSLVELADRVVVSLTPVPLMGTETLEKLPVTVAAPETVPADFGENWIVRVAAVPALRATGSVSPPTLNPLPDAVAAEMVSGVLPAFFN